MKHVVSNREKLLWKPGTMLYPLPAVLVTSGDVAGVRNVLTVAWTGIVCSDPAMCYVSVRPERYSYELIRKSGEYVVNLTTAALARATDWCGVRSGREYDKFAAAGLTPVPASIVKAPLIAESPVSLECRVTEVKELGTHHMFLAEIVAVHAAAAYFDPESGRFDLAAADPLSYSHGHYYHLGRPIGKFGFSVEKKRRRNREKGNQQ